MSTHIYNTEYQNLCDMADIGGDVGDVVIPEEIYGAPEPVWGLLPRL